MRPGVRLACDVGSVRIGIARSDPNGMLAVPLDAVKAGDRAMKDVALLVAQYEAVEIIVGLALSMDGTEGKAAGLARTWASDLASEVDIPIRMVDERLTTVQAQRGLHAAGRTVRNSRAVIDSASAVVLLQSDLDAQRNREARNESD